jgi:hypothetical protein
LRLATTDSSNLDRQEWPYCPIAIVNSRRREFNRQGAIDLLLPSVHNLTNVLIEVISLLHGLIFGGRLAVASGGSGGEKAAADSFEIPPWLLAIQKHEDPINTPASGEWLFVLHPHGQVFWLWFWWVVLAICIAILFAIWCLSVHFLGPATLAAATEVLSNSKGSILISDILMLFVLAALFVVPLAFVLRLVPRIKKRIVRYSKKRWGFYLRVAFEGGECKMTKADSFSPNPIWPKRKDESRTSHGHPSTVQNTLPRIYDFQKIGRIKLRFDESGSKRTYIFQPCRWLLEDVFKASIGFALAVVTYALPTFVFASQQPTSSGIAVLTWACYAVSLSALLYGIAITPYIIRQRWKAAEAGIAVILKQDQTATLAWNQYLGIRKGFHSVAVLLDDDDALSQLCERLQGLQRQGTLFMLARM